MPAADPSTYRGRLAPSPTGHLHLGHLATFNVAAERARRHHGELIYRNEDLDPQRSRASYVQSAMEDLRWMGIEWQAGPDRSGPDVPYNQSQRLPHYIAAWRQLHQAGYLYPCARSRKDLAHAARAPHAEDEMGEALYPLEFRPDYRYQAHTQAPGAHNWRFRVPENQAITFQDQRLGHITAIGQKDFGDFLVWRKDGVPAYELAVVVDDAAMGITEVVRGEDLLRSTARQLLLYQALQFSAPDFYHTALIKDSTGRRLAKRNAADSIRVLREKGMRPSEVKQLIQERLEA